MSAILDTLREARAALEAAQKAMDALQADPKLKKYQDFEKKLRALMGEYSMSLVDVNTLLDSSYVPPQIKAPTPAAKVAKPKSKAADKAAGKATGKAAKSPRKTRSTRTYTNPNTGEKIVYLGGINKALEEWKEKWGADVVKGWGILDKPAPEQQQQPE